MHYKVANNHKRLENRADEQLMIAKADGERYNLDVRISFLIFMSF